MCWEVCYNLLGDALGVEHRRGFINSFGGADYRVYRLTRRRQELVDQGHGYGYSCRHAKLGEVPEMQVPPDSAKHARCGIEVGDTLQLDIDAI